MNSIKKNSQLDVKVKISLFCIVVMFTMIMADILSFMFPEGDKPEFEITQGIFLIFAILLEIPIIMILLSRVLPYRINRWANIFASIITIVFVIGGGSALLHYYFFASVEIICMLLIIWHAWKWKNTENGKFYERK